MDKYDNTRRLEVLPWSMASRRSVRLRGEVGGGVARAGNWAASRGRWPLAVEGRIRPEYEAAGERGHSYPYLRTSLVTTRLRAQVSLQRDLGLSMKSTLLWSTPGRDIAADRYLGLLGRIGGAGLVGIGVTVAE